MASSYSLYEFGRLIVREGGCWNLFAEIGVPDDSAPDEIVQLVADANELSARLQSVFEQLETAAGVTEDDR